jgi:PIN domain nuclease of toxin-antitoxin system
LHVDLALHKANERFLLDTSAFLTLIEDEAGADRVEEVQRILFSDP